MNAFESDLQRIADNRNLSIEDIKKKWYSYKSDFMMGKIITPPNLIDFQKYYI